MVVSSSEVAAVFDRWRKLNFAVSEVAEPSHPDHHEATRGRTKAR